MPLPPPPRAFQSRYDNRPAERFDARTGPWRGRNAVDRRPAMTVREGGWSISVEAGESVHCVATIRLTGSMGGGKTIAIPAIALLQVVGELSEIYGDVLRRHGPGVFRAAHEGEHGRWVPPAAPSSAPTTTDDEPDDAA